MQKRKKHPFASLTAPISTAHKIQIEVDLSNKHRAIVGGIDKHLDKTRLLPRQFQQIVPFGGLLEGEAVGSQGFGNHRLGHA